VIARLICGAVLGMLIAYPALLALVLAAATPVVSQPAVLAVSAGVLLWPRLARRARGRLR
jgi:hypothetical protein